MLVERGVAKGLKKVRWDARGGQRVRMRLQEACDAGGRDECVAEVKGWV